MASSVLQDFCRLVLLSALIAVCGKKISINGPFARYTEKMNDRQRHAGSTRKLLPVVQLGPRVKYINAEFLGVDSLKRTGECWHELRGMDLVFEINYGFQLLTVVLPHLEVDAKNMSGFVRVRDNSVNMTYTLHQAEKKCLTLNNLTIDMLENVEFGASRLDYDGTNLDGLFKLVVKPTLNSIIQANLSRIDASLQTLCNSRDLEKIGSGQHFVMPLL